MKSFFKDMSETYYVGKGTFENNQLLISRSCFKSIEIRRISLIEF